MRSKLADASNRTRAAWRAFSFLAVLFCALSPFAHVSADEKLDANSVGASVQNGWVTVVPREFEGAVNNPLKGFREFKKNGYGLLERQYIKWNEIKNFT